MAGTKVPRDPNLPPELRRFLDDISRQLDSLSATVGSLTPAPSDASYVTIGTNATLSNERTLAAGSNISVTDGGAGNAVTVAFTGQIGGATLAVDNQAHGGGTTMTLTGWAAGTKMLAILLTGLSHNNGANQNLRVALSGDGSTYGTANIITAAAVSAATALFGVVIIGRVDKTSNFPVVVGTIGGIGALEAGVTGPVTHAQLSFAAGNFDAGSASVYAFA